MKPKLKHKSSDLPQPEQRYAEPPLGDVESGSTSAAASGRTFDNLLHLRTYENASPPGSARCGGGAFGGCGLTTRQRQRQEKTRTVALSIGGVISMVLVVEMIIVIALLTGPLIGVFTSMKTALDFLGGQSVRVALSVDSGPNLTSILSDKDGLISTAAQLLGPPAATPLEVRNFDEGEGEGEAAEGQEESVFLKWCQEAPCLADERERISCAALDADLASARSASGAPVIPLPRTFCNAVSVLSASKCLCDPDLANPAVSGEASSLVKSAAMIGPLCRVDMLVPSNGKC